MGEVRLDKFPGPLQNKNLRFSKELGNCGFLLKTDKWRVGKVGISIGQKAPALVHRHNRRGRLPSCLGRKYHLGRTR